MTKKQNNIILNDFNLFYDVMKATSKILESAKFIVNENGLSIYGARAKIARCELTTNAIYSNSELEFSILDMNMLVKILGSIKEIHENDYSELKFYLDLPFIRFESKKFKTKLNTCNEDIIERWISKKIETPLQPVFEFTTTSDLIRHVTSHSYIFPDQNTLRFYLETNDKMENNILYAVLGNKSTNLNNEITLKFGYVTSGTLENRNVILDLERLTLFNAIPCNEIKISLMNLNVLVSKIKITGKNDTYFSMNIYNTILKS